MNSIKAGSIYKRKYVKGKEYYFVTRVEKQKNINGIPHPDVIIICYRLDNPGCEMFFYEENIKSVWSEIKNVGQIRD